MTMLDAFRALVGSSFADGPSPLGRWLHGTLRAANEGTLTVEFVVRSEFLNPAGTLHGGVITAMLDDVMGATVYSLGLPHVYASVNISVDFLSSARPGDVVTVRSEVVRQGRTIINMRAELTRADGRLLARATSNLCRIGE
jgi:uncharacterized protein (TIGR00369 family)